MDSVHLTFLLGEEDTTVRSRLRLAPNPAAGADGDRPGLLLNGGADLKLVSVAVDSTPLADAQYTVTPKGMALAPGALPAGPCELEIVTSVRPQDNSSLEGLYKSSGNFCTQCEAEGFRSITFFPDRPDVMAT